MRRRTRLAGKKVSLKPVTFEVAMGWLRRGKPIRRRGWHSASQIFRLGPHVFVKLPGAEPDMRSFGTYERAPSVWRPYPQDFLSTDWEKAKA